MDPWFLEIAPPGPTASCFQTGKMLIDADAVCMDSLCGEACASVHLFCHPPAVIGPPGGGPVEEPISPSVVGIVAVVGDQDHLARAASAIRRMVFENGKEEDPKGDHFLGG